nr:ATP-binding protein [Nostoc sp. EkiNYC01]
MRYNLFANAISYTVIEVTFAVILDSSDRVIIQVKNTSIGIPPDMKN